MAIDLDVVTRLDRSAAREAAREAQRYFEGAGRDAGENFGDDFSKGLSGKTAEIQKSFDKVTAASGKLIVEQEKLNALKEKGNATDAQLIAQSQRVAKAYQDESAALQDANRALNDHDAASRDAADSSRQLAEELDRARARFTGSAAAIHQAVDATRALHAEESTLQTLMRRGDTDRETLIVQSNRVAEARRAEKDAVSLAGDGYREFERATKSLAGSSTGLIATLSEAGGALRGVSGLLTPAALVGIGSALVEVAGMAASASQSILLLPAAVGAAASAFGTLKLATLGFGDAIEAIKDPEKFAEAIAQLSPNAQRAALSIQSLMPTLEGLQRATQDALFANVGPTLANLSSQLMPTIQSLTTGIAGAFNQAFQGIASQLMTPGTQAAIENFTTNVVSAFQQLAPAVEPLTRAFGDLMSVGSDFLPSIASAATNAANAFAVFIHEAMNSGQLRQWLSEGLDTLKQLGSIAFSLAEAFMALAPTGRDVLPQIVDMLDNIQSIMPAIGAAALLLGPPIGLWVDGINKASQAFDAIKGVVSSVGNAVVPILQKITAAIDAMLQPIRMAIDVANKVPGVSIPQIPSVNGRGGGIGGGGATVAKSPDPGAPFAPGMSAADRWSQADAAAHPGANDGLPNGMYRKRDGSIGFTAPPSLQTGGIPTPLSGPYAPVKGGKGSEPPPVFDPSQWQVDPSSPPSQAALDMVTPATGLTPTTGMPPGMAFPGMGTTTGPGGLVVDQSKIYDAQTSEMTARSNLESANLRILELQAKGNASQREIHDAKSDQLEKERAYTKAQRELIEAQNGTYKKANDSISGAMGDLKSIFAPMDEDFGISGGLPGIAKWLVTFLGNMALGSAIGSSPVLQQAALSLMADGNGGGGAGYGAGGYGGGGIGIGGGGYANPNVNAMLNLAQQSSGNVRYAPASDLINGLADCSGSISDLVEMLQTGRTNPGRSFTTTNFATDAQAAQLGFQPGYQPGALNVGVNPYPGQSGHMAATLPNGVNFEGGGGTGGGAQYGGGASGALDPQFEKHYFMPVGGVPMGPAAMGPAPLGGGAGPWSPMGVGPAPGPTGWGSNAGMPNVIPGSAGQGFLGGPQQGPGAGAAAGQPGGLSSLAPSAAPGGGGEGGIGVGGGMMDAAMASTAALDMMAPGAGQAAKIGIQLANRAIKFGGQAAAIGVSGVMETLLPHTSALGDPGKSWFGKIAGGIAGARPAAPNQAGKSAPPQQQGEQQHGANAGQPPGPMVNIEHMETGGADGQGVGSDIARQQYAMHSAGGPR